MINKYNFEKGKYRVERDDTTYEIKIFRNDERWSVMEEEVKHSKLFHAMLNKIDSLEIKSSWNDDYEPTFHFFRD